MKGDLLSKLDKVVEGTPYTEIAKGMVDKELKETYSSVLWTGQDFPYPTKTGYYEFWSKELSLKGGGTAPARLAVVDAHLHFVWFNVAEDFPGDCTIEVQEKWWLESSTGGEWTTDSKDETWKTQIGPKKPEPYPEALSNTTIARLAEPLGSGFSCCDKQIILGDLSHVMSVLGGEIAGQAMPKDLRNFTVEQRISVGGDWTGPFEWSIGRKGR